MVRAAQKGEAKASSPEVARAASSIKMKDAKKFASTKHKGLPEKKMKKESVSEDAKMARQSDDKLSAAHKKFSSMEQTPANSFMKKRIAKEIARRKKGIGAKKVEEAMSSYDRNRKAAAKRAEKRNAERRAGTRGGRMERETYRNEAGVEMHHKGYRANPKEETHPMSLGVITEKKKGVVKIKVNRPIKAKVTDIGAGGKEYVRKNWEQTTVTNDGSKLSPLHVPGGPNSQFNADGTKKVLKKTLNKVRGTAFKTEDKEAYHTMSTKEFNKTHRDFKSGSKKKGNARVTKGVTNPSGTTTPSSRRVKFTDEYVPENIVKNVGAAMKKVGKKFKDFMNKPIMAPNINKQQHMQKIRNSGGDPSHWESVQTEAISFKRKKKDKKSSSSYVGKRDAGAIAAKRMRDKEQQKYVSFLPANEEKKFGPGGDPIKRPGFVDKALKKLKNTVPVKKIDTDIKTEAKELKKAKINYKTTKKGGKTTHHVNKNDESDAQKAMKNDPKYILGKTRVKPVKEGFWDKIKNDLNFVKKAKDTVNTYNDKLKKNNDAINKVMPGTATLNKEESCGKGMYYCKDMKKCKPIPEGYKVESDGNLVKEGAAWTKKSGKNPSGGLNEKGRKSYERENPGSDLKAPQPGGGSRKKSFCARMSGMKKKLTSKKTASDPDSRINKSLRKWKCNEDSLQEMPDKLSDLLKGDKSYDLTNARERMIYNRLKKAGKNPLIKKVDEATRYKKEKGYDKGGTKKPTGPKVKDAALDAVKSKYKGQIMRKGSNQPKKVKGQKSTGVGKYLAKHKAKQQLKKDTKEMGYGKDTKSYVNARARYGSKENMKSGKGLGT